MIVVEVTTIVVQVCCECARLCADSSLIVHVCALMMVPVHALDALKGRPRVVRSVNPCLGYPGAPPCVL